MPAATTNRSPSSQADYGTVRQAELQLQKAAKALEAMADQVAAAKQIKEYDSDRRKRILSICVSSFLELGESATAAEHKARASKAYEEAFAKLVVEYRSALEVIERYEAQRILWESSRSLLSMEKAKVSML